MAQPKNQHEPTASIQVISNIVDTMSMSTELLLARTRASLDDNQNNESLELLRKYQDILSVSGHRHDSSPSDHHDSVQLLLDTRKGVIDALQAHLEKFAYTWDKADAAATTFDEEILLHISQLYKDIAAISAKHRDILEIDNDDVAEHFLDWAIAAKRAGLIDECVQAHTKRMEEVPDLVRTDAVRLIGIHNDEGNDKKGLFETELVTRSADNRCSFLAHIPTKNAIELGKRTSGMFEIATYTFSKCTEILQHVLSSSNDENCFIPSIRVYSANSFFNHRRAAFAIYDDLKYCDDLKVLVFLFLFGVSLKETQVVAALGLENVEVLFESGILTRHPVDDTMVLGEVQIYPLSTNTFDEGKGQPLYIMTDWSLESLLLPKHAIMTIGYDSLELVALAAGVDVFAPTGTTFQSSRVLDLCCGSGIQGIFSAKRSISWADSEIGCELISMDINPRACQFVCANACLNDLVSNGNTIYSIEADLYQPLHSMFEGVQLDNFIGDVNFIGNVDMILSNPPFVAVPVTNIPRLDPPFYAAGGGYDGMKLVQKIVNKCFASLSEGNGSPQLLMVTELPNVETSCALLETFLDDPIGAQINVAYIDDDVELMEDYSKEREEEAGQLVVGRNWTTTGWIKNRALVLISISKNVRCDTTKHGLFCFDEKRVHACSSCDADEEDKFLTAKGVAFARTHLITR
jgi:methylase of polypeptide subunit release factors